MTPPLTKTQQAINLYKAGQVRQALRLAKTFKMGLTKDEQSKLAVAFECFDNGGFYAQLGKCPQDLIASGCQVFEDKIIGANREKK